MTEDRFSDFFAANFPDVWRFARRRTESGTEADDIAAETFAVAWRRREEIPAEAARLWLFGVARLVLANHRRESERRGRLHLRLVTESAGTSGYQPSAPSDDIVWPALAALSDDDRELLLLRAWDGLGVTEIATVLESTPAVISSRLYKARGRLDAEIRRRDPARAGHVPAEPHGERSRRHDPS